MRALDAQPVQRKVPAEARTVSGRYLTLLCESTVGLKVVGQQLADGVSGRKSAFVRMAEPSR